ncbi:restriction endonuclease subunit S [Legionella sp. 29fVS95]|uniref:restriction endonuclease subunit S n=1 Tax=Legionella sp. 29fVS95 TaxID=3402813 RepID=UPI003AF6012A
MRQSWAIKTLGEVSEIMNGGTPDTTVPKFWDGDYLWITPKDMGKMKGIYIDDTFRKITDEGLKNSSAKILPVNSIILSSRAPIGHLAINTKPISTNQGCKGLIPKIGVNTLYLYYFLLNSVELLNSLGTGATFKELSGSKLATVKIPLPPLSEQQRIVAILDEAFTALAKAKANAEQNLKNAKELFESYLQSINAEKKPLGNLVDIKTGKLNSNAAVEGGKFPFFTCSREIFAINNYAFDLEAILLAGNNASGDFNVKHYKGKFNAYQRTYVITVNKENKVLYRYLYFQLLNSLKEFKEKSVGANTRFLKLGMIQDMQIALPNILEQETIVQKLDALSAETKKLEAVYQAIINNLDELKKSILQKAFSGELTKVEVVAS